MIRFEDILDNKSIDAVIISTTDHWHDKIAIAAMKKGKAVYCEKPLTHSIDEGNAILKKQAETKLPVQVGIPEVGIGGDNRRQVDELAAP